MNIRSPLECDLPRIADLLIQLYQEEAPEMLPGLQERYAPIITRLLTASGPFVREKSYIIEDKGKIVGYAAFAPQDTPRSYNPSLGHVRQTIRDLGCVDGFRYLLGTPRLMNVVCSPLPKGVGQLHSLVVSRHARGNGYGRDLCYHIERIASQDHDSILLHILKGNDVLEFYQRLGYVLTRPPRQDNAIKQWYRYSSSAMIKYLKS